MNSWGQMDQKHHIILSKITHWQDTKCKNGLHLQLLQAIKYDVFRPFFQKSLNQSYTSLCTDTACSFNLLFLEKEASQLEH